MRKLSLKELNRISVEEFKQKKKRPIIIVMDNVRSALNVGSAFRTADAFSIEKIILVGICAKPPHREILKTAIGATESVQWEYHEKNDTVLTFLHENGYSIYPVEQAKESTKLQDIDYNPEQKIALFFGNEVNGVSQEIMDKADLCIEIPQFGTKHSLNVSVSLGIVTWHFVEKSLN